jgi:hypothetical protein
MRTGALVSGSRYESKPTSHTVTPPTVRGFVREVASGGTPCGAGPLNTVFQKATTWAGVASVARASLGVRDAAATTAPMSAAQTDGRDEWRTETSSVNEVAGCGSQMHRVAQTFIRSRLSSCH